MSTYNKRAMVERTTCYSRMRSIGCRKPDPALVLNDPFSHQSGSWSRDVTQRSSRGVRFTYTFILYQKSISILTQNFWRDDSRSSVSCLHLSPCEQGIFFTPLSPKYPFLFPRNFEMASTEDLHISNLFSLKGHVCLVTGGGEISQSAQRHWFWI